MTSRGKLHDLIAAVGTIFESAHPGGVKAPTVPVPENPLWRGDTKPDPVPEANVVLSMPDDMYRHDGAPTEWWWHIGTLRAGDRVFGFELNAASFAGHGFAMTQLSLSDVDAKRHYERTQVYGPAPIGTFAVAHWAEGDPSKDWFAKLGDPGWLVGGFSVTAGGDGYTKAPKVVIEGDGSGASGIAVLDAAGHVAQIVLLQPGEGYTSAPSVTLTGGEGGTGATAVAVRNSVSMSAPQADPTKDIHVQAVLADSATLDEVVFDLTFSQQGRPFYVFGTGLEPKAVKQSLREDNYYFSFTRLAASGTITVGGTEHRVSGTTWMDHEYGFFGGSGADSRIRWLLQDLQLDNGYTISNAGIIGPGFTPQIGVTVEAFATLQDADGAMYYVASQVTPVGELWVSPDTGFAYVQTFRVVIPSFQADIAVTARLQDQEFSIAGTPVYEGIASADGTMLGSPVSGDAWIEQAY
jgi:predicted secreted hydrolase